VSRLAVARPVVTRLIALAAVVLSVGGCNEKGTFVAFQQTHSSTVAVTPDGSRLVVVHPDADSVSIVTLATRAIEHEVFLAGGPPAVDPATQRYDPSVLPRALALDSSGSVLYVTGQRSGLLYKVDPQRGAVVASVPVCSEPVGVVVGLDDEDVYVACAQDDAVVDVDAASFTVVATVPCPRKPWSLAWAADSHTLITTHLLGPGVSFFETSPLMLRETVTLSDGPSTGDPTEPHGQVRGIYDAVVRPGTQDLWIAHLMLGTDTTQPTLNFQSTAFPNLTLLNGGETQVARLSVSVQPDDGGAFGDIVSGPRSLAFTADGRFAIVVDADSEDLLVVDAERRVETQLVRPLPGHLPEGVAVLADQVYVQERNTEDVAVYQIQSADNGVTLVANGSFPSVGHDPMPSELRLGQNLFYSANSDQVPITQNHWIACATCHVEGGSDAVVWLFAQGPRDTPTNRGGMIGTGFLFRTADRSRVQDYWETINTEQGGHFSATAPSQIPLLDALADYVNFAIPVPIPPQTDPVLRAQGEAVFVQSGCLGCHTGPLHTDSGAANPTLDLGGPMVGAPVAGGVLLHDVGTCVTQGPWPDVAHDDIAGDPRRACAFDTPALRGLWDSAPFLHDGSAATLDDAVTAMLRAVGLSTGQPAPVLSQSDRDALVEYLRSL
jgi:DNA-binding beta-propeller fold protein YncE